MISSQTGDLQADARYYRSPRAAQTLPARSCSGRRCACRRPPFPTCRQVCACGRPAHSAMRVPAWQEQRKCEPALLLFSSKSYARKYLLPGRKHSRTPLCPFATKHTSAP